MPTPSPSPTPDLTFAAIVAELLKGAKCSRREWNSTACIFVHATVLHLRKEDGSLHSLLVSEGDLAATDWFVVREH
jgi:hypothetical protein